MQHVIGGSFDDVLAGDDRDNKLQGTGDDDHLTGAAGNDSLAGEDGDDRILGGTGRDHPLGGNGDDRIDGGPGSDEIFGGDGRDTIRGAAGSDLLLGDEGNDRIDGGPGADSLDGSGGADMLTGHDEGIDALTCGQTGHFNRRSVALADTRDLVRGCGRIRRPSPAQPVLVSARQDQGRSVLAQIGCSQDMRRGCRGTIQLLIRGRVVDRHTVQMVPSTGRGYRLLAPRERFRTATRGCRLLPVTIRFSGRTASGAWVTSRRPATLSADDAGCGRHRPDAVLSITTW